MPYHAIMRQWITLILALVTVGLIGSCVAVAERQWYVYAALPGHRAAVVAVTMNEDATRAASLDAQGGLILWDLEALRKVAAVELQPSRGTLKAGEAAVVMSPDGSVVAASAPALRTVVWPTDGGELVLIPVGTAWTPLLAVSHSSRMLATMDPAGNLRTWETASGGHIADYANNPHPTPEDVVQLQFSKHNEAVGYIENEGGGRYCRVATGESLRWNGTSGGSYASRDRGPAGFQYREAAYDHKIIDNELEDVDEVQIRLAIRYARVFPDIHPRPATRDQSAVISLDANLALYAGSGTMLGLLRPSQSGDVLRYPHAYLALVAGLALALWLITGRSADSRRSIQPDAILNSQPLPLSTRTTAVCAALQGAAAGLFTVLLGAAVGLWGVVLVPAGILIWVRRSDGWRKVAVCYFWIAMLGVAGLLGAILADLPLDDILGNSAGTIPPPWAGLILFAVLTLFIWFWWSLTNPQVREMFAAAQFKDTLAHLRRCGQCGYDIRATIAHGGDTCPECGHGFRYSIDELAQIRDEFQRLTS